MERINDKIIKEKYKHISERNFPFEDNITEVYVEERVNFSNRTDFLHSLYFVTSKGYYFKYSDTKEPNSYINSSECHPFQKFLDGILDAAWVLAYHSNPENIKRFIMRNLEEGMLHCRKVKTCGEHFGKFYFLWTLRWYSYLLPEEREN